MDDGVRTPPAGVLAAYELSARPVRLPGGQGRAWRVGSAVLKPLDLTPGGLQWQAELLARLSGRDDLRVSVPLRSTDGRLVVQGWTAWRYEPGRHLPGRWAEVVDAGRRLHAALAGEPRPPFLDERRDRWAVADRVAWGEVGDDAPHLSRLRAALAAGGGEPAASQLVHGDLTGNVLFADGLPPLVIDLSPYWRPPGYAEAVVPADALLHHGAGESDVAPLVRDPQHLLRALLFRAGTDRDLSRLGPAVDLALRLAG